MWSTFFGIPAVRSVKRGERRPPRLPNRALRLEPLETRELLTVVAGVALTGCPLTAAVGAADQLPVVVLNGGSATNAVAPAAAITQTAGALVTPVALKTFSVTGLPSPYMAGTQQTMTVTAVDASGNTLTNYTGTVHFTSNDVNAVLPADYTFQASDAGTHQFMVTLYSTGTSRSVTVTDTATGRSGKETVSPVTASTAVRYATTTNTIYVTSGTMTLTQIHALLPKAPLILVDPVNAIWKLNANIVLQNGATLLLHGTSIGGDVNQLRLKSDNVTGANAFVYIAAKYGDIDINSTTITSWDSAVNGPDTNFANGRAYIRASSMLAADGVTPQDSRMDILNSDVGYLGYYTEEAYGLSWKVEGNPGPNHGAISNVHVYGNIENDHIHNNFFGIYTYGFQGDFGAYTNLNNNSGQWTNNEVDHNVVYGFDLHNYSDGILIQGNNAHNNGLYPTDYHIGWTYYQSGPGYNAQTALFGHGIILSIGCDGNVINNNHSWGNEGHGIMLHKDSSNNVVTGNLSENNTQSGVAVFDSYNNQIDGNTLRNNTLDGLRFTVAAANNTAQNNMIYGNANYGIELFPGNDKPLAGGNGHPNNNTLLQNQIYNNAQGAISVMQGDHNTFQQNVIYGNGNAQVLFNQAVDNIFSGNTFVNPATGIADANVVVSTIGTSTIKSNTIISGQPSLLVNLDKNSTLTSNDAQFSLIPVSAALTLNLRVANLTPGKTYSALRNGVLIGTFTADANGLIQFSDKPGTTAVVQYQVQ